jgi:hypothetical protein
MTTIRQFSRIALAMLTMTGRVTMLGIARWTGAGGSYRTVHRFFATVLPWAALFWLFFRTHLFQADDVYLLGGDETIVTKAGKHTHGLDRFFASLYGKSVSGLAFFTLSLISTKHRRSFPIQVEQVVRTPEEQAAARAKTAAKLAGHAAPKRKPTERQYHQRQRDRGVDAGTDSHSDHDPPLACAHWHPVSADLSGPGWALWEQQRAPDGAAVPAPVDL